MFDFSNFPLVCRICFKLTLDCSINDCAQLDYDKRSLTYKDLLNELCLVSTEEHTTGLPTHICKTCKQHLEELSNLRRQAAQILKFSIALMKFKQSNDYEPVVDLFKSDESDQLQHVLSNLNVIDSEEFTIEKLIQNIKNDCTVGTVEKEVVFEEVTIDVATNLNCDTKSDSELSNNGIVEQESELEEPTRNLNSKSRKTIIHKNGQKFKLCPMAGCGEEYLVGNRAAYLQHEKNFHRYGCNVCGRVLASRTSFNNHVLLHDGEQAKVKCEFCVRTFTTKGNMMVHIREVHNNTGIHFHCQYCEKGFMEQKDLNAHLHDHNVCKICDESFADLPGWINHTRREHLDTLFTCDHCDHTSLSLALLDRHKRMKHSESSNEQKPRRFTVFAINSAAFEQCPRCNLLFTSEEFVLQHNDEVHNKTQINGQDRGTIKRRTKEEREKFALRYSCDICGKRYRFKNSLWSHRHKEHSLDQKTAICDICGQNFKHHSYLAAHIANIHATEFPFRCECCPKAYSQAYLLKEHAKSHDTEKRHKCPHCDYRAKQAHLVKDHVIRMHSTERPAKCSECDRAFINNSELKKHMAIHSGKMHFQCDECDQVFRRKMDLGRHRARIHLRTTLGKRRIMDKTSNDDSDGKGQPHSIPKAPSAVKKKNDRKLAIAERLS